MIDVSGLPRKRDERNRDWMRVPAENILDVLSFTGYVSGTSTHCPQPVHVSLDGQELVLTNLAAEHSLQRPVVATMPDGRKLLLRTRTNSRDFQATPPTPGAVP